MSDIQLNITTHILKTKTKAKTKRKMGKISRSTSVPNTDYKITMINKVKNRSPHRITVLNQIETLEQKKAVTKIKNSGTSLVVQWLRLRTSNAGDVGSISGQGTKIPHAAWCGK